MSSAPWGLWFWASAVIAAAILCTAGAIRALSAALAVRRHAAHVVPRELLARVVTAKADGERIRAAVEEIRTLPAQSSAAVARIHAALAELKLPQAVRALRLAGIALRLLFAR